MRAGNLDMLKVLVQNGYVYPLRDQCRLQRTSAERAVFVTPLWAALTRDLLEDAQVSFELHRKV